MTLNHEAIQKQVEDLRWRDSVKHYKGVFGMAADTIESLIAEVERLRAEMGKSRDALILALTPWMDHRNGAVTIRMTELLDIVSGSSGGQPTSTSTGDPE